LAKKYYFIIKTLTSAGAYNFINTFINYITGAYLQLNIYEYESTVLYFTDSLRLSEN